MKLENVLKDFQHEILLLGKNNHDFRVSMFVFKLRNERLKDGILKTTNSVDDDFNVLSLNYLNAI
uniref:Uncharacterized protein n=1 Tax=Schistosoma haematobium TaxID=6185 RepID=A0A095C085_SCHHA